LIHIQFTGVVFPQVRFFTAEGAEGAEGGNEKKRETTGWKSNYASLFFYQRGRMKVYISANIIRR
jgi:hypothetical protein